MVPAAQAAPRAVTTAVAARLTAAEYVPSHQQRQ
jgi:hypothetical protein